MSKRNRKKNGYYSDNYWQSADWNRRSYSMYQQWIAAMAANRYKWTGLPATCDERYLEFILLRNNVASIAHPKGMPGTFFSTMANTDGRWNVYDTPTHWQSIGNNGWRFNASPETGVLVYDNRMRLPNWNAVDFFARRLAALDRVSDINMQQQSTPYLITAPREMVNDARQIYKQLSGGEPAILAKPTISNIGIEAISTGVPFLGKELTDKKLALWDEVYSYFGISHVGQKSERLTSEEVSASNEPSNLMALDGLNARREAADKLNDRFGLNVHVVWRKDNESDTYNFLRNPLLNENILLNESRTATNDGLELSHE